MVIPFWREERDGPKRRQDFRCGVLAVARPLLLAQRRRDSCLPAQRKCKSLSLAPKQRHSSTAPP